VYNNLYQTLKASSAKIFARAPQLRRLRSKLQIQNPLRHQVP
jgi:hypothetical protein